MTSQAQFLKDLLAESTIASTSKDDSKIDTSYGRLFQIKKDVSDLRNSFENITKFGLSVDEIQEVNNSSKYAEELKSVVNHPSIATAARLKTAHETGDLDNLKKLLNDDAKPDYTSQNTGQIDKVLLSARLTAPPETPVLPKIQNKHILKVVFTHTSSVDNPKYEVTESNERLEFLGKSILNQIISLILFKSFPDYKMSELTKLREEIVTNKILSKWSYEYGFDRLLVADPTSENQSSSHEEKYSEVFEAYVGGSFSGQER